MQAREDICHHAISVKRRSVVRELCDHPPPHAIICQTVPQFAGKQTACGLAQCGASGYPRPLASLRHYAPACAACLPANAAIPLQRLRTAAILPCAMIRKPCAATHCTSIPTPARR